ncbi:MAG TPA: hypothetical protein VM683_06800 [Anaeromyxobacteraceae bacterium]|nr:hypothetical protein [Anaeromyxobacteraceae bacterium]
MIALTNVPRAMRLAPVLLRLIAAAAWLAGGVAAAAEDPPAERSARLEAPHAVYFEVLGKGGVYGVGYDWAFADRLAVGGTASFVVIDDQRVVTLAPYVSAYPFAGRSSALLVQFGAEFVHVSVPSTVPGFSGTTSTGLGGQFSVGYEFRSRFLFRFLATGVFGRGGFRPWAGIGLGGAFR